MRQVCAAEDLIPRLLSLRPQDSLQQLTSDAVDGPASFPSGKSPQAGWRFAITDRFRPGQIFKRRDAAILPASGVETPAARMTQVVEVKSTDDTDSESGSGDTASGRPPAFVSGALKPITQQAASLRNLAGSAPQRLWHRRKVSQVILH